MLGTKSNLGRRFFGCSHHRCVVCTLTSAVCGTVLNMFTHTSLNSVDWLPSKSAWGYGFVFWGVWPLVLPWLQFSYLCITRIYVNAKLSSLGRNKKWCRGEERESVVISIHHLSNCLVTTSINTIEQKMSQARWKNLSTAFQGEV